MQARAATFAAGRAVRLDSYRYSAENFAPSPTGRNSMVM